MVISLVGEPKSGKTDWALTAEGPIKHEEFDLGGFERAAWRFKKQVQMKMIETQVFQVAGAEDSDKHVALGMLKGQIGNDLSAATRVTQPDTVGFKELWYSFLTQYVKDVTSGKYKTIIIDSATALWPICHRALLQEKQEAARKASGGQKTRERLTEIEYGPANDRFLPMIQAAREMDVNLILVHHTTEERQDLMVDGKVAKVLTGRMLPAGWRHMRKWIDLEIWFEMGQFSIKDAQPAEWAKMNKDGPHVGGIPMVPATKSTIEVSGMHRDAAGMRFFDSTWFTVINAMKMLRGEEVTRSTYGIGEN